MEHRYSPRVQGALDVEISCKGRHLGRFRTRDVSFEGMFLETGAADLEPNDFLGLSLKVNGQSYSMRGVVVHGSRAGVGVMLVGGYLGYCRLILDAIDRGALHVPAQPVTTPAAAALRDQTPERVAATGRQAGREPGPGSKPLLVRMGDRLDVSANEKIQEAIRSIKVTAADRVVVDLAATQNVYDSGVALLLLLREEAEGLKDRIYLTNCRPEVRTRLAHAGIASQFHVT